MSYLAVLRDEPAFRRLWLGKVVSFIGDWFSTIALYEATMALSSSGRAVSMVLVAKTLPIFLMVPIAGPLIDRFDRRNILVGTTFMRAACTVLMVIAHMAGSLGGLYAVAVISMALAGVAIPASNAVLPMTVPAEKVPIANALSGGTWSAMLAIGAALGGVATALFGIDAAFLIDGGTFIASAVLFSGLPRLPAPAMKQGERRAGFVDGLRYLFRDRYMLAVASLKSLMQLSGGILSLLPLYGTSVFAGVSGPAYVGLLFAIRGVGSVFGSLGLRVVFGDDPRTMRRVIAGAFVTLSLAYAGLSLSAAFWQAAVALFFAALGGGTIWVYSGTLIQIEGEPRFHGRVFSVDIGMGTLLLAASSFSAGWALDLGVHLDEVAAMAAALALLSATVWAAVLVRMRRRPATRAVILR